MGIMYEQLSAGERGTIMALRSQGSSIRAVAAVLHRAPSTIGGEGRQLDARLCGYDGTAGLGVPTREAS